MKRNKWESIQYRRRYMSNWYRRHKKRIHKQSTEWARKYPQRSLEMTRKSKYGIGANIQRLLLENGCMICGREATHIDHNHRTNKVRGALCNNCNTGLGMFQDSPKLLLWAAAYLNEEVEHKVV
jgi:hypothetical protein